MMKLKEKFTTFDTFLFRITLNHASTETQLRRSLFDMH